MNKILIIGGAGFIGRNLIEQLTSLDYSIRLLDIIKPAWLNNKIEFYEGNFTSDSVIEHALSDINIVYHLASTTIPQTSNEDPIFDIRSNLIGTVKVLNLSIKKNIKKFVFVSSGGTVYGIPETCPIPETAPTNPICSYGIVKLAIEKYLKLFHNLHGLDCCSLRVANPYGRYQRYDRAHGVINVFCHKALNNEQIQIWGDGNLKRDFIYIDDAISAMISALKYNHKGDEINIGSGKSVSLNEIVSIIKQEIKEHLDVVYKPFRGFDVPDNSLDITKASKILNWTPEVDLKSGILKTINWLNEFS
jgi:UDP-glucose 4-epimerase